MPNASDDLSVAELERMLNSRRMQLEDLQKKRTRMQHQLDQINAEIAGLTGDRRGAGTRGRRGPRAKNEKSLREHVVEMLAKSKKGLTLADLAQKVLEAGYKSGSTNFRNVLYQCVYNTKDVYHDESTGTYKMKSIAAKDAKEKADAK
jgi:hypothetical protein